MLLNVNAVVGTSMFLRMCTCMLKLKKNMVRTVIKFAAWMVMSLVPTISVAKCFYSTSYNYIAQAHPTML